MALLLAGSTVCSLEAGPYLNKSSAREQAARSAASNIRTLSDRLADRIAECGVYLDENRPFPPSPAAVYAAPDAPASDDPRAFSLNPDTALAPSIGEEDLERIAQARSYFDERGYRYGYLLVSLDTGRCIGGGYDTPVYGASTFKGVLCAYICESLIDTGALSKGRVESLVMSTIVSSNNDTYRALHNAYAHSGKGLSAWVENLGISSENVCRFRFPTYSARESAALWTHIASYLESDGESAAWLASLYEQTNVSHIRAAVECGIAEGSIGCEEGWRVMNKAGWIAGSANSTSDAGIVEIDGRRYVLSIMTGAPDCAASREACSQLALALLQAAI